MRSMPPRKNTPSYWNPARQDEVYLHLGETPFAPTERVQEAISNAARYANRYPDTNAVRLRKKLAEYIGHGVTEANINVGNGSDDLIDLAVVAFTREAETILTFEPTFFIYTLCARRHGRTSLQLRQNPDYHLPDPAETPIPDDVKLTFITHPNNPTATLTPRERVIEWLDRLPGAVVVDECYFEYSGATVADLIHRYENLIVFRSLSKSFALSGVRLGYAISNPAMIEILENHALTFPVNAIAQAAGIAALGDVEEYKAKIAALIEERECMAEALKSMGLAVLPSATNFLLAQGFAESPAAKLAQQGLFVSDQSHAMGRPAIRIAIGSPGQNQALIERLSQML